MTSAASGSVRNGSSSASALVADHLVNAFDAAALDVRRGWREGRLDAAVAELDRLVQRLAEAAQAPERNAADPFTVDAPHRPITNSGP
jgi:hypothetical protein